MSQAKYCINLLIKMRHHLLSLINKNEKRRNRPSELVSLSKSSKQYDDIRLSRYFVQYMCYRSEIIGVGVLI